VAPDLDLDNPSNLMPLGRTERFFKVSS